MTGIRSHEGERTDLPGNANGNLPRAIIQGAAHVNRARNRDWPVGPAVPIRGNARSVMHAPLTTSPELLAAIERAKNYVMTPQEKFEQRVSFVYGQCHKSGRSKEQIRQQLIDLMGHP